jgi:hypothetical protein
MDRLFGGDLCGETITIGGFNSSQEKTTWLIGTIIQGWVENSNTMKPP